MAGVVGGMVFSIVPSATSFYWRISGRKYMQFLRADITFIQPKRAVRGAATCAITRGLHRQPSHCLGLQRASSPKGPDCPRWASFLTFPIPVVGFKDHLPKPSLESLREDDSAESAIMVV